MANADNVEQTKNSSILGMTMATIVLGVSGGLQWGVNVGLVLAFGYLGLVSLVTYNHAARAMTMGAMFKLAQHLIQAYVKETRQAQKAKGRSDVH